MRFTRETTTSDIYHLIEKANLLSGYDTPASHPFWGYSEINEKGETLFDFIFNANPLGHIADCTPTFHFLSSGDCDGGKKGFTITLLADS